MSSWNGAQPGDPVKAAKQMYALAKLPAEELPLRVGLGSDYYKFMVGKAKTMGEEVEKWKEYTLACDVD